MAVGNGNIQHWIIGELISPLLYNVSCILEVDWSSATYLQTFAMKSGICGYIDLFCALCCL
jgi:hypothetical protein